MAHYAFLDANNVVVEVITGCEDESTDWEAFYGDVRGLRCKRTSYNTFGGVHLNGGEPFRKNYAGIGFVYDESRDAFIPERPYPSWVLNETTCQWEAPIALPDTDNVYRWDEDTLEWVVVPDGV